VLFKFYEDNYTAINNELTQEILKTIQPHLKSFNSLKQNLNIVDNTTEKNINSAISKYTYTIRAIFESMTDFFQSKNFLSKEFVFLSYMGTSNSFPMFKYFSNFELSRIKIKPSGMIEIKNFKEQMIIIGGFIIIRILLLNIIFEFYRNENNLNKPTSAKYFTLPSIH
jgi:hypothetical protein